MEREKALGLLGIATTASARQIRMAYRMKAKESHPDMGGTSELFDRVTLAYRLLMQLAVDDGDVVNLSPEEQRLDSSIRRTVNSGSLSLDAFGPVNDPLIRTDQAAISRFKR